MTTFEIISVIIASISSLAAVISAISAIKIIKEFIEFKNSINIKQNVKGNNNKQSIGDINNGRWN